MSKLDIKIQGVRGNSPTWQENKGKAVLFIDNEYNSSNYISADAFNGFGSEYKRGDKTLITVQFNQNNWVGTIEELAIKLNIK